jgi:hypothetical protein
MLNLKPSDPDTGEFSAFKNAQRLLLIGLVVSLAMPVVFATQAASPSAFLSVGAVGLAIVAAAVAGGGIVGFIFGIPRLLQDARPAPPASTTGASLGAESSKDQMAPYAGNTSLEQISDWLTKILVGVGLTQLANLPTGLTAMGTFLAPGLGNLPGASIFAICVVVFAILIGFFLSYLWTRLNLASLFVESDARAREAAAEHRGFERGEMQTLEATTTAAAVGNEARGTRDAKGAPRIINALWVDDRPANNVIEMQSMEKLLGVKFVTKISTEDALEELTAHPDEFAFVITDMSRPGDPRAGYTLLDEMRARGITAPVIIYSRGSGSYDRVARDRGAVGATNRASTLLEFVTRIIGGTGR